MDDTKQMCALNGKFEGPVTEGGGEAVDARKSQGLVYKPTGLVNQHFGDTYIFQGYVSPPLNYHSDISHIITFYTRTE